MPNTNRNRAYLQLAVFILGFFAVWTVRATYGYAVDESFTSPGARVAYSTTVKFLLWVVPAYVFVRWVRGQRPLDYLGVTRMPSLRQWAWCLAVLGCFLAALTVSETTILDRKHFEWARVAANATAPGLTLAIAVPLFEEILFRGLFTNEIRRFRGPGMAAVLTALLFAAVHLPNWTWRYGLSGALLANAAGVFVFGLVAAWLYLRTSSIWPPTIAHIANNLLASLLVIGSR